MVYKAFALKYRPQNFAEVIGQEHIVSALTKAILNEHIHHAYLFSGPRGVGKTSLARILAKSLNCSQGPTVKPCGKCLSCQEITKGISLDVIEIDGASNRGIDEIRTLRENVKLASSYCRYKIYIIDEVHMLTKEAFNALLKTLEEPPSHVKFIFATTHPQKVLPTILSRCQKFQFHFLPVEKVVEKLRKIIKNEGLNIDDSFLYPIARSSGGSIRDAESLLDQLAPLFMDEQVPLDIMSFLGIIDEESLNIMVRFIAERNLKGALNFINKLSKEGKDLGVFVNSLIEHLRNLILVKLSPKTFKDLVYVSPQTKDLLSHQAELLGVSDVLKIIDLLVQAKDLSKKLNSVRIPFEIGLVKFCYKGEDSTIKPVVLAPASAPAPEAKDKKDKPGKDNSSADLILDESWDKFELEDEGEEKTQDSPKFSEAQISENSRDVAIEFNEIRAGWQKVILEIRKTKVSLASYLLEANLSSFEKGFLKLAFPKRFAFHKEIAEKEQNRIFLEKVLTAYFKKPLGVKFILAKDDSSFTQNYSQRTGEYNDENREDNRKDNREDNRDDQDQEFIDTLLDTFGGSYDT